MNPADPTKFKALTYDERGVAIQVDDEGGLGRTTYGVDADRRLTSITRSRSASVSDTWTLVTTWIGELFSVTDPDGKALVTRYDDLGRLVRQVSPDQMETRNSYTPLRRVATSARLAQTR